MKLAENALRQFKLPRQRNKYTMVAKEGVVTVLFPVLLAAEFVR